MREGRKKIKKEQTVEEKLTAFKNAETKAIEDDKLLHDKSWENIDPNHLIGECKEIFGLFLKGDLDSLSSAKNNILVAKEETAKIKDKEKRESNDAFIKWVDDRIEAARGIQIDKEEISKN